MTDDYYPFGLAFNSYSGENSVDQNYLYNSAELQVELDLNWLDYGWRNYDPSIGRFNTIDNFADSYFDLNPYQYGANNPIKYVDVNGDSLMLFKNGIYVGMHDDGKEEKTGYITQTASNVSTSFVTMEGHIEKGVITFSINQNEDGTITFGINSKSEVDQGAAKAIAEDYSRSEQMESWKEVLTNFVGMTGGKEKSREVKVNGKAVN